MACHGTFPEMINPHFDNMIHSLSKCSLHMGHKDLLYSPHQIQGKLSTLNGQEIDYSKADEPKVNVEFE